ncbi:MAG: hypothetical protein J6J21_00745 [Clostridia bacterium]|nr:hypothetical protein [Clostridia bacterium]
MAKYRITDRRKKVSPALGFVPTDAAPVADAPTMPSPITSGDAAFRLYEEFFTPELPSQSVDESVEDLLDEVSADESATTVEETPAAEESRAPLFEERAEASGDRIDPRSVEPTREFDLDDVRRAFAKEAYTQKPVEAEPKVEEAPKPAVSEADNMGEFFSALFGEEKKSKKTGLFSKKSSGAEAPTLPAIPAADALDAGLAAAAAVAENAVGAAVSSDTIRVPDTSIPEVKDPFEPTEQTTFTRASIGDLVSSRTVEKEAVSAAEEEEDEFVRPEQAEDIAVGLKKTARTLWRRFIALAVLFGLTFYLESACHTGLAFPLPEFLTPGRFNTVYLLVYLQLIVFASAFAWSQIKSGFVGLFGGRAGADSVPTVALLVTAIHVVVLLCFFSTQSDYVLFGSVAVFLCACGALRRALEHRADVLAFRLLAEEGPKYAAAKQPDDSAELAAFAEHLGEEIPVAFSVSRAAFADGFFRRTAKNGGFGGTSFAVALPITLLLSVGIAVWCFLGGGSNDPVYALDAFVCAMMMGLPAASIFSHTLPYFFAQRRAAKTGTALIGESAVEESAPAEIVSFDDTEVFLPRHVKVTSVRTYGAARIDKILIYCAQIFREVGGPLSFVFENSISSLSVPGVVEILENNGDGICARIDGKELYLGRNDYMESYEFPVEIDETDADFENRVGRIMYLAIDGELCAKFYIKYAVSARFEKQLSALSRAGIYVAVKTCDPNVDALLLQKILGTDLPLGVIKTGSAAKNAAPEEHVDAPIVGKNKIAGVLNGFLLCDAVRSRASLGALVKFVSMLLGLFITFVLTGMQNAYLTPTVCLLYQLLWLVPVVVPSLFDWPAPPRRVKKRN